MSNHVELKCTHHFEFAGTECWGNGVPHSFPFVSLQIGYHF